MFQSLTLYHYWRSSASWRVRWMLELKKLKVDFIHVELLNGEVDREPHLSRNPMGQVPALIVDNHTLIESMAILEWLEETIPANRLIPGDTWIRAHIRALCEVINSGTQPVQNLPVLDYYSEDPEKRKEWMRFFIHRGLTAYEKLVAAKAGKFSVGDQLTAADVFLVPQCYNAIRNDLSLSEWPTIDRIHSAALATAECQASHPERFQPK